MTKDSFEIIKVAEIAEGAAAHATAIGRELGELKARLSIFEDRVPAQPPEWKRQYELLVGRVNSLELGRAMPLGIHDTLTILQRRMNEHLAAHDKSGDDSECDDDRDKPLVELLRRCLGYLDERGAKPLVGPVQRACYYSLMAEIEETLADFEE